MNDTTATPGPSMSTYAQACAAYSALKRIEAALEAAEIQTTFTGITERARWSNCPSSFNDPLLSITGFDWFRIAIRHEQSTQWGHEFTGKMRVIITSPGHRKPAQFPQRKDGTFNIPAIVENIQGTIETSHLVQAEADITKSMDVVAAEVAQEFPRFRRNLHGTSTFGEIRLNLSEIRLTPEKMRQLLTTLNSLQKVTS